MSDYIWKAEGYRSTGDARRRSVYRSPHQEDVLEQLQPQRQKENWPIQTEFMG